MTVDQNITCFSKDYPLNVVQEEVYKYIDKKVNLFVASNTGTGKTNCFCMKAYKHLFKTKGKSTVVYIAPTKALVEEKKEEFENKDHPYYKFQIVTITSDYSDKDKENAKRADIILMTPESFSHRVRNHTSTKHEWILDIGLLCIDEFHIIDDEGRGSHIEASLIDFCRINPDSELMMLSATVPNYEEIAEWVDLLNPQDTIVIKSDFRPTRLHEEFIPIYSNNYKEIYERKITKIKKIVADRGKDQAIIGVFNKYFGQKITDELTKSGYKVAFHHGALKKSERKTVETNFKKGYTQFIVCTKTLFAGVNFPADYVISTAVKAGGGDVKVYELKQMAGRSGRPQYGKDGTVFYFIESDDNYDYHENRIKNGEPILSQMGIVANVALHFLGTVNLGIVKNREDFTDWYKETLYYHQKGEGNLNVALLCEKVEKALVDRFMIKITDNGTYKLTRRGLICTQMSLDPILANDLIRNFSFFFKNEKRFDYLKIAKCLGECLPYRQFIASESASEISINLRKAIAEPYYTSVLSYYYIMNHENPPKFLLSSLYSYKGDFSRLCQVLNRFGQESENWGEFSKKLFNTLPILAYSKVSYDEAYLVSQGATPFQAKRLAKRGVSDIGDI